MNPRRGIGYAALVLLAGVAAAYFCMDAFLKDPVPVGQPTPAPEGVGWIDLLDEQHADGWRNFTDDKEIFSVEDGLLHIFGRTIYPLRYVGYAPQMFSDFDLHLEFRLAPRANSGVFLRSHPDDPVQRGIEIQVIDDHGKRPSKNGTGAVYDVVTPMFNMALPAGKWNSYDLSLHGTHLAVTVNGWKVVDTDFALMDRPLGKFDVPYSELARDGLLALQDHGGEVWYRNIRIRPLWDTPEAAP